MRRDKAYCRHSQRLGKRSTLVMKRENLLHDIENIAYVEGHVMNPENIEGKHMTQDIVQKQSGGLSRAEGLLNIAHKIVVELLYPFTKTTEVDSEVSDDSWRPEEYRIELQLPEGFSNTTLHLLSRLVHEYMVYRVLYDWLSMTCPEKAENWLLHIKEAEEEIDKAKNARTQATTRPPWP